MNDGNVML